ncbi:MAG: hypothetical protein OEV49_12555 [candidate division Zixibacteria bacterium]|nr:hypothetical protein [candidate division Zixibacteria bacterium]MDH3939121.1 hypothetical protein [candidate division Zixibacteria bacterium]MDH4032479.1 hypothetical protein [candidate division Zixibacteria bacterium]
MRKLLPLTLLITIMLLMTAGTLWSAENVDNEYLRKVGDYFDVSYEDVDRIAAGNVTIEEVPTVFFMAQLAKMSPKEVLAVKAEVPKWSDFMNIYDIHPSAVLIDIYRYDTPECKAIGLKVNNRPLSEVVFENEDVIIMVNYRVIAATSNIEYSQIVNRRNGNPGERPTFVDISHQSAKGPILVDSEE